MTDKPQFTMLYDGACPICRAEVRWLNRFNGDGHLAFEDVNDEAFRPEAYGASKDELMARIHGVTAEGKVISGVEVFRRSYDAVGLGWIMAPSRWPLFSGLADRLYAVFARHRIGLGRFIDRLVARFH